MYAEDTIVAIATPPGCGGVGIVRISGAISTAIAALLFEAKIPIHAWQSHHLYLGRLRNPNGALIDEGLAVVMRAPHSYTGEDVVEFHCHGSPVLLRQLLSVVLDSGARAADAGEFTKRAFLNGKLDLVQAEAVIDVITARTGAAAGLAIEQLSGNVSSWVRGLREQIIRLKVLIEAQIDFAEEDFVVDRSELLLQVRACQEAIEKISDTFRWGKQIRDGLRLVIVGRPNVGKSSLLNALLGEDRAIVTSVAGTTRDVIEESIDLHGIPLVIADTAGLRPQEDAELVEQIGIERTLKTLGASDLALVVLDSSKRIEAEDEAVLEVTKDIRRVIILNKSDLEARTFARDFPHDMVAVVSAASHAGLDDLRNKMMEVVDASPDGFELPVISRVRQHACLDQAGKSLGLAARSVAENSPPDLIAVDVQDALDYLGEITGSVTNEDVLDRLFSEFCVGK